MSQEERTIRLNSVEWDKNASLEQKIDDLLYELFQYGHAKTEIETSTVKDLERISNRLRRQRIKHQELLLSESKR